MTANNMRQMRVMIDREGEHEASLFAARSLAEAARERQPTACETCTCKACEEARLLPMVQRILAAAAARREALPPAPVEKVVCGSCNGEPNSKVNDWGVGCEECSNRGYNWEPS